MLTTTLFVIGKSIQVLSTMVVWIWIWLSSSWSFKLLMLRCCCHVYHNVDFVHINLGDIHFNGKHESRSFFVKVSAIFTAKTGFFFNNAVGSFPAAWDSYLFIFYGFFSLEKVFLQITKNIFVFVKKHCTCAYFGLFPFTHMKRRPRRTFPVACVYVLSSFAVSVHVISSVSLSSTHWTNTLGTHCL